MTPEEHAEWERSVTKAWPEETRTAGNDRWAAYFDAHRKKSRQLIDAGFEQVTDALAQKWHEQRRKTRAEFAALSAELRAEVVALSKEINAEMLALKRERQNLIEQEHATAEQTRQLRLVAGNGRF